MSEKKKKTSSGRAATVRRTAVKRKGRTSGKKTAVRRKSSPLQMFIITAGILALSFLGITVIRQQKAIMELQKAVLPESSGNTTKGKKERVEDTGKPGDEKQKTDDQNEEEQNKTTESVVSLFLLSYDETRDVVQYVPVKRKFRDVTVNTALAALIKGPDSREKERGLLTTIPPGLKIRSVSVEGDTATIDLSAEFMEEAFGDIAVNRINQIYMTATQFSNISSIVIHIEGKPLDEIDGRYIEWPMKRRL